MADMEMKFENEAYDDDDDDIDENKLTTDTVLDQARVNETNPVSRFTFTQSAQAQVHAERGKLGEDISNLEDTRHVVDADIFKKVQIIDKKDKFID